MESSAAPTMFFAGSAAENKVPTEQKREKIEFLKKEVDRLHDQVKDLKQTLTINKEIIASLV